VQRCPLALAWCWEAWGIFEWQGWRWSHPHAEATDCHNVLAVIAEQDAAGSTLLVRLARIGIELFRLRGFHQQDLNC